MDKWTKDKIKYSSPAKTWRKAMEQYLKADMLMLFFTAIWGFATIFISVKLFIILTICIAIVFGFYIIKHILQYTTSINMLYRLNNEEYDAYTKEYLTAKNKKSGKIGLVMTKGIDLFNTFIPWDRIQSITFTYRRELNLFLLFPEDPYFVNPAKIVVKVRCFGPINIKIIRGIDSKQDISSDIKSFIDDIPSCKATLFTIKNDYHFVN